MNVIKQNIDNSLIACLSCIYSKADVDIDIGIIQCNHESNTILTVKCNESKQTDTWYFILKHGSKSFKSK